MSARSLQQQATGELAAGFMNTKELQKYSIVAAIASAMEDGKPGGLYREASDEMARITGRQPSGFYIAQQALEANFSDVFGLTSVDRTRLNQAIQNRALSAGSSTAGGFTVGTDVLGSSMIEMLRNKTVVGQMGVKTLSGLVGNVSIPKVSGGATATWLAEGASVSATDQSFGQLVMTPHRLVGDTAYSKELLMQSSVDIEHFVRDDITRVLAVAKDLAAIAGTGVAGQPLGIINTTGLSTAVTFGAAATFAKMVEFETIVATNNADVGSLHYLTTPAARGKMKIKPKEAGQAIYVWENGDIVNSYKSFSTLQVPSDKCIFGAWSDAIFADWAGVDIVVDPYTLKKENKVEICITLWCDFGIRHPLSFCVSSDSAAQ